MGVPMSGKVGAIFRPLAGKLHLSSFTRDWAFPINGRPDGLGVPDEWAFPSNVMAFPSNGRSDECQGRCKLPPAGGKLHLPQFTDEWAFPFNGRSENGNAH